MRVPALSLLALLGLYLVAGGPAIPGAKTPAETAPRDAFAAPSACADGLAGMMRPAARDPRLVQLQRYLGREVCAGRISPGRAEAAIAGNWLAAYRKYLGP